MLKVLMCNWYGKKNVENMAPSWFVHDQTLEISWDQLKELYETGLNIKLSHKENGLSLLGVSDTGFGQIG